MYPFISPYLHLMQRAQPQAPAPSLLSSFDATGAGLGSLLQPRQPDPSTAPPDPFDLDAEARRRARNQGLIGLGSALLEASSSGDVAGGIGRGMQAFVAGREGSLDRDRALGLARREEERRAAAEGRAVSAESRAQAQEIDRDREADLSMEANRARMTAFTEDRTRETAKRQATGKSATEMVAEINALAASVPTDETLQRLAKRATGYALGEDADLDRLDAIYTEMVGRAGRDSEMDWKRGQEIETAEVQARRGFGPIAEGRRAEEGLDLDRLRTSYYGRQTDKQFDRDPNVKPASWYDDVNKEIDKLIEPVIKGRMENVGKIDMTRTADPDYDVAKSGIPRFEAPTPEELATLRQSVEQTAIENVNRRYGMFGEGQDDRRGAGPEVHARPDPSTQSQADQVRNGALTRIRAGATPEQVAAEIRAKGEKLYGYTPEQYVENALRIARRNGWVK